jgi:AcrR family transcriptional regulator
MSDAGPRRRSRRDERSEETRADLLDAALRLFADEGFYNASLAKIAVEAGYTTGAIYHHFGGKDELFLAAFERYALTRVDELVETGRRARGPLPARMRALADQWMQRQDADPSFLVIALEFAAHAWRKPSVRSALAARAGAIPVAVGRLIEEAARADGIELPMPAEDLALALRQLGVGLALARLTDPEIAASLFGDFVELFFELAMSDGGDGRRGAQGAEHR